MRPKTGFGGNLAVRVVRGDQGRDASSRRPSAISAWPASAWPTARVVGHCPPTRWPAAASASSFRPRESRKPGHSFRLNSR